MATNNQIHPTAVVDQPCIIGAGTRVWHFSHICTGAEIGADCNLGQNTFIAGGVVVGDRVKVQNNVSLYDGITIEDDVFLGPSCVLTNITNPRSQVIRKALYEKTLVRQGATIGANATIVCGTQIGLYAFVGAGAVVRSDVPDYAMMLGVPAVQNSWVSRHGHKLEFDDGGMAVCPESKLRYQLEDGQVCCLDLSEKNPLPEELASGKGAYQDFKKEEYL